MEVSILVRGTINTVRVSVFDAILNLSPFRSSTPCMGIGASEDSRERSMPTYAARLNSANFVFNLSE